jgi:hypothetical protein
MQQEQQQEQQHQQQQHRWQPNQPNNVAAGEQGARSDVPGSFSSLAYEQRFGVVEQQTYGDYGGYPPDRADSFGEFAAGGGGSGSNRTWGGLFKSAAKTAAVLGKKGLKAAQVGRAVGRLALYCRGLCIPGLIPQQRLR